MTGRTAAAVLAVLLVSSGCIGFLTGEEPLSFEANEVSVGADARSQAGYEQTRKESQTVTRNFSVANQTRRVKVTNHIAEYKRQVSVPVVGDGELARFTVVSTPKVEVLNQTFNPVGSFSNRRIARQFQKEYDSIKDVQHVGDREVQVLGETRTASKFSARATTVGGREVDVYLHIAKFPHGEDFIVAVAVHPQALDGEQGRVDTMLSGVRHATADG